MPISGPVVHQQLMDIYTRVQTDLQKEREDLLSHDTAREQLFDSRGEALVELAQHYLPELTEQAIRNTWAEVQPSFQQVLHRKQLESDRLAKELQQLILDRQSKEHSLVRISAELDAAIEQQDEVASKVEMKLRENADFVALSDRAAAAEAALERAEANLQEIDQDSVRKLPAYNDSTLFKYLHDRGFGTSEYKKRGFTRRMDRWVAKLIDYNKARQSFEFLSKTPEQMRKIIAEDRDALDVVMTDLERRRDEVADQFSLPERIAAVSDLAARRDDTLQEIDLAMNLCNQHQIKLIETEDTRGPYYQEAITMFRDTLSRVDATDLERHARLTAEITDDQIVSKLQNVDSQIDQLDEKTKQRHVGLARSQKFLEDLGQVIQRFRAAGFDSSRSQFVGSLDILEELDRSREAGNAELLWQRIRNNQRWGPTTMDKITAVATHPMTQVLVNAMAHAAGSALESHARRAGNRRSRNDGRGQGRYHRKN